MFRYSLVEFVLLMIGSVVAAIVILALVAFGLLILIGLIDNWRDDRRRAIMAIGRREGIEIGRANREIRR